MLPSRPVPVRSDIGGGYPLGVSTRLLGFASVDRFGYISIDTATYSLGYRLTVAQITTMV